MDEQQPNKTLLDYAAGDPRLATALATSLRSMAAQAKNPDNKKLIDDVLAGKADLRDVLRTKGVASRFGETALPRVRSFMALSEEQRAEAIAKAEATLTAHYDRLVEERKKRSGEPGGGVRGQ
ncbi:hypothetical protein [Actinocrispum wychmicini]|uniref:Uncharacterized protein n=1 Tax=Actinocrispum wychmicini TaxID=1213861 RepID=A0A4R2J310_9PSEU|nr:hypothetical protein [Actinocrispum wychmicini]TCO50719.1 hypothetical protein EV192_11397 [Actinocrispum wychmicini]